VRDLRVQEFLKELVVSVAAPGDLAGSFLVKILHCGEGDDVEQVDRSSKQISRVTIAHLSLNSLVIISYLLLIVYIFICLIFTCA